MIDIKKIDREWLVASSREIHGDPLLLEKVIRALLLVEGLVQGGLNFIFKGGTALMLLMGKPARFSIDADILLPPESFDMDMTPFFEKLVQTGRFTGFELRTRKKTGVLKKQHYKFFYKSFVHPADTLDSIILDIVFEDGLYNSIDAVPVTLPFLPGTGKSVTVRVPDAENLLGDKLTAFAPNTTGIPYEKNNNSMSLEIIKQIYDIGKLFPLVKKIQNVRDAFSNCAYKQIIYRKAQFSMADVFEDIFQTSLCLSTQGKAGTGKYEELKAGVDKIKSFIFSESYTLPKAVVNAGMAASIAMLLRQDNAQIAEYTGAATVMEMEIKVKELTLLNKLKRSNPEAFFYWYKALEARS